MRAVFFVATDIVAACVRPLSSRVTCHKRTAVARNFARIAEEGREKRKIITAPGGGKEGKVAEDVANVVRGYLDGNYGIRIGQTRRLVTFRTFVGLP